MLYTFDQIFAADPANPERVASNGSVTIFAPGDATQAPIAIKTVDGLAITNPVQVNDAGYGPAFTHDTLDRVAWSGGGFSGFLTSYDGIKNEAVAARMSAQEAAAAAEEAAANTSIPTSESVRRELETDGAPANQAIKAIVATAAAGFAVKPDNGNTPVGKSELLVNAKDFGAKGDGVTNESASIQSAVDWIKSAGGGTLYFPPGRYWVPVNVYLCDNITITGSGATLLKKGGDVNYAVFAGSSAGKKGYGGGPSKITCHGLIFEGTFGQNGRTLCAFALHHSQDVLVYNCTFTRCSGGGHRFDLQGCRRVTIRDNVFEGFDTIYGTGQYYNEDIQLDYSGAAAMSFPETGTDSYDGLPCEDVTVDNNKWLQLKVGQTTYPAANPMGVHGCIEGMIHKNIRFTNNRVDAGVEDVVNFVHGRLHLMAVTGLIISGNTFDGGGKAHEAIRLYIGLFGATVGNPGGPNDVTNKASTNVSLADPHICSNVQITGNVFRDFSSEATAANVIHIAGQTNGKRHRDISILNNVFRDNKFGNDPVPNNGGILIYVLDADRVTVEGNTATMQRRFCQMMRTTGATIRRNDISRSSNNVIIMEASDMTRIEGNNIAEETGSPVIALGTSQRARVTENTIRSKTAGGIGILFNDQVANSTVRGNMIHPNGVVHGLGIRLVSSSVGNVVSDNFVLGSTAAITVDATSSATQANNVTA